MSDPQPSTLNPQLHVRLLELVCPASHCLMAACYLPGHGAVEEAMRQIVEFLEARQIYPWCEICATHQLDFRSCQTEWTSVAEAMPFLQVRAHAVIIARRQLVLATGRLN